MAFVKMLLLSVFVQPSCSFQRALRVRMGTGRSTKNLWALLVRDLQAECPSCHPTNSVRAEIRCWKYSMSKVNVQKANC